MKKLTCILFFLYSMMTVAQTEVFKTKINFSANALNDFDSSMSIDSTQIYFNASDFRIYAHDKKTGILNWSYFNRKINSIAPIPYKNYVFAEKQFDILNNKTVQLNAKTGDTIQFLNIENMCSQPIFDGDFMYCTATVPNVGGSVLKYDLKKNVVVWEKFIGSALSIQPYYFKNKIVANAKNDNWFEIDYNGNFMKVNSKELAFVDTSEVFVKNYKFLTHDGKEISEDFLKKNKISIEHYQTKNNDTNTFIITDNQLLVLGNKKKKVLQLDLGAAFAIDNFEYSVYYNILTINPESIWFCYQNQLIHYDFKNKKLLRKVDLNPWNPHQVVVENRTIWLISKNDGQLYGLDFEPDQRQADEVAARANQNICTEPDPKKIEAAKEIQEKLKK